MEIFIFPRILYLVKRSRLKFIPQAFRAKFAHNVIGNEVPIITEKIF